MGRKKHPEPLTPAEQRVLEEVRTGATNAEIAMRLGLSINTVKYHVANMLSKLEAEDRKDLAAWSGDTRRKRLWLVLSLGGAGALGAIAVVLLALHLAGGSQSRQILVAEPILSDTDTDFHKGSLVITELLSGETHEIRSAGDSSYQRPKWSPDGERLIAFEFGGAVYRIWDNRANQIARMDQLRGFPRFSWAPDSSRVLVTSSSFVGAFDRDGVQVASMEIPDQRISDRTGDSSWGPVWSADSAYYAYMWNGTLVIGGAHGDPRTFAVEDLFPGIPTDRFLPLGWHSNSELEVIIANGPNGFDGYYIDVRQPNLVAGASHPVNTPAPNATPPPLPEGTDRIRAANPDRELMAASTTADGRGTYFSLDDPNNRLNRPRSLLVVVADGQDFKRSLDRKDSFNVVPASIDVVLVGDWPQP